MDLVTKAMVPAMDEVGRRFEEEEYFIPELLISGRAMKEAMKLIQPLLAEAGAEPAGRVVIGTVKGDLHDIGKNLVASMLQGGGFEVVDIGVDVPEEKFIEAAKENKAHIICLSTLLTTTMPAMKSAVEAVGQSDLNVKIMVGGAPVTQQYADEIGAHSYGDNARSAVTAARELMAAAG
jgi:methylmalonyl-CoA mutase cobalamin-binding domain/chain